MRQIPLGLGPSEAQSFDTFLTGANQALLEQLRGLLTQDRPAPAYLWGEEGAGKTHLLRALAYEVQCAGGRVGWFDASMSAPWEFDESWRMIVLDDCGSYDAEQQHAAFGLFVQASTHGLPVAAAGTLPPVDLPVRDDLRTRLGWGHVLHVLPLTESERRAVLRRDADQRGIILSDEVMSYLLTRFSRDLGSLIGLLDRLDRYALATHRAVTVPLLKQMLAEEGA